MSLPATETSWTFEATAPAPRRPGRRILLLSFHYAPSSAAGAVRWERFTAHAAERGWGVDAFTLAWDRIAQADPASLRELPGGTRILGVPDPDPYLLRVENRLARSIARPGGSAHLENDATAPPSDAARTAPGALPPDREPTSLAAPEMKFQPSSARSWYRAYSALVTALRERSWAHRAARLAARRFDPSLHKLVVSSGPPHATHLGAALLAERTGLPLVLDLRDPWSLVERLPEHLASPIWLGLSRRWERQAIARAALVTLNTEASRRAMASLYPSRASDVICVMNGYDEDPVPEAPAERRFVVAYAGAIYLDRSPRTLFQAAARVIRDLSLRPAEFAIELMGWMGDLDGVSIPAMAAREGIERYVSVRGPGTRAEAARFLAGACLLVSLPQDSDLAIPSKIFDYMRYPAWVLSLARRGSATELLLRDTPADVVEPDDVEALAAVLRRRLLQHRGGTRPAPLSSEVALSRRAQAEILFDAIEARLPGDARA